MTTRSIVTIFLLAILAAPPNLQADTLSFGINSEKVNSSSVLNNVSPRQLNILGNDPSDDFNAAHMRHLNFYFQDQSITITKLNGGISGATNYKVTNSDQEYALRILNPVTCMEEKQQEIRAAIYAGELGIAPRIRYVSPEYDAIIMDFISGPTLSFALIQDKETFFDLLKVIRQLHKSTGYFPQRNTVFETIKLKLERFPQNTSPISLDRISKALEKLQAIEEKFTSQPLVPCHNDLNALNIIKDVIGFKLIDWTESCMNYVYIDLGYFALTNCIQEEQHHELLSLYLDHFPSKKELALLKWGKQVAMLRLFATIFLDHEPPIKSDQQRIKRQAEVEQILEDPLLPTLDYFCDLHRRGLLNNNELAISLSLCALRTFLNSEFP